MKIEILHKIVMALLVIFILSSLFMAIFSVYRDSLNKYKITYFGSTYYSEHIERVGSCVHLLDIDIYLCGDYKIEVSR